MTKTVTLPEDVVASIQHANAELEVAQDVLSQFIEAHSEDTAQPNTTAINSLTSIAADKKLAFEKAKSDMSSKYVPETAKNWSLNYNTCVLSYTV